MKTLFFLFLIFLIFFYTIFLIAEENKTANDFFNTGISKANSGNHEGAIIEYNKAIQLEPEREEFYQKRGVSKATIGDYQGSQDDFKKADSIITERKIREARQREEAKKREIARKKQEERKIQEEKRKAEEEKEKERKLKEAERKRKEEIVRKYYAKLKNPPGFYDGAFLISFMGGTTISPSGSYISHEKVYDQRLQGKILTNQVNQDLPADLKGYYFQPSYKPGVASQFDFEYGWKDRIGLGFTIMQNSITALRQDVIPGIISYVNEYAELFPSKRTIYRGSSMMFLSTYHPIPKNFFDPYAAIRIGVVGFTGEAHSGIDSDRFAFTNKVNNGIGGIVGLAGGLNIYIGRFIGIKTEVAYYKEYLRADQFSTRTLNSYQAMIGVFLNFSNLQYSLETPKNF